MPAVATGSKYSASGYKVGDVTSHKERLAEVDFLRAAFDSFDVDKSGYIDPQELRAGLTMLGVRSSRDKATNQMSFMGLEDKDGDGTISLQDLDADGDEKISFEEFKVFAAILPKRDHPIYRKALAAKPIVLPRDTRKQTPVQIDQHKAQQEMKEALNAALGRLREKLRLTTDAKIMKDNNLLRSFNKLDISSDGRVDIKEIHNFLQDQSVDGEVTKRDAWLIMNCADSNNDKVMTFDEFKKMMQTVARGT